MKVIDFSSTIIELQKNGLYFEIRNSSNEVILRLKNFTGLVIIEGNKIIYEYQSK